MKQPLVWILFAVTVAIVLNHRSAAEESIAALSRSVQRVPAGVIVNENGSSRWNRMVMVAKPRIASGDADAVPGFLQQTVSKFVLTILATVDDRLESETASFSGENSSGNSPSQSTNARASKSSQGHYRLVEVGVGHSVQVGGRLVVIMPDDYEKHGVRLSFLERQILTENQRQFADIRTIVRTSTLLMFDVPCLLLRDGRHQEFTMRHLVWVDSKTGSLSTLLWLLENSKAAGENQNRNDRSVMQALASEPICCWDTQQMEDRAIHVDKSEFTFGIPGKRAFALVAMPLGRPIQWNQAALGLSGLSSYSKEELMVLMSALNTANQESIEHDRSGKP